MKYLKQLLCALLCAGTLTGCTFLTGGDDLLQAPKASRTFVLLQKQLDSLMGDDLTFISPQTGSFRNTVAFEDLDSDGQNEALAFLRDSSSGQIYVYAFQLVDNGYRQLGHIEGQGTALDSVSFLQLPDGKGEAVVLTWALSGDVGQGLTVCSLENGQLSSILETTYTNYTVCDMDGDKDDELLVLSYDSKSHNIAQVYGYQDGAMSLLGQTDASQNVQSVVNIQEGLLSADGQQAVFVDNKFESDNGMQTDIYVLYQGALHNLALSADVSTYRSVAQYYSDDVNNDGIVEVPLLRELPQQSKKPGSTLWLQEWYSYSLTDAPKKVCTTYTSLTEEWSLTFPDSWCNDHVTAYILSGGDVSQTVFTAVEDGTVLLTIFVYTGRDHEKMAQENQVISLSETNNISYAASLGRDTEHKLVLKKGALKHAFRVTQAEWR